MSDKQDFIAIVFLGAGGGSYYRCADKVEAATKAIAQARKDWGNYYDFGEKRTRKVAVWNVTGHASVSWDDFGVWDSDTNEAITKREVVEVFA